MIIDSTFLSGLAVGTDRVQPETDDLSIHVPNTLLPVVDPCLPHVFGLISGTDYRSSIVIHQDLPLNNIVASSSNICTINKGLYNVRYSAAAKFSYTSAGGATPELRLQGTYQSNAWDICCFRAQIGVWRSEGVFRLNVTSIFVFRFSWATIGVAEFIDSNASLNIEKVF